MGLFCNFVPHISDKYKKKMWKLLLFTLIIVALCVLFLGIKIFFVKDGKFPHFHISGNPEMEKRGIGCVESQDREAQTPSRLAVKERK